MGSKERRSREKQELRGRILEVAREMFVEEGYEAMTMRALAKRIEYSPTAIYLHFKDKDALIAELCRTDMGALTTAIHAAIDVLPLPERLPAAARIYVRFALAHPKQYQLLFMTPKPRHRPDAVAVEESGQPDPEREAYMLLHHHFAALIAAGHTAPGYDDPDLLAQVYFCGMHGIVATAICMGDAPLASWRGVEPQIDAFVKILTTAIQRPVQQPAPNKSRN